MVFTTFCCSLIYCSSFCRIIPNCIMKAKSERRRPFVGDQLEDCRDASGLFYILPFQKVRYLSFCAELSMNIWEVVLKSTIYMKWETVYKCQERCLLSCHLFNLWHWNLVTAKDQSLNDLAITAQWLSMVILHSLYATAQWQ